MKKPKFTSVMVIASLLLCAVYGAVAIWFQYHSGEELSPTLTENWFKVFGIEIAGTTVIAITKKITSMEKIKEKIQLKKDNSIEITPKDFTENSDCSYDGDYYDSDLMG